MTKKLLLGLCLLGAIGFVHAADTGKVGNMIPADQIEWKEFGPGSPVKIALLWGDRNSGDYAMLL